ncbi:bacillopeptidase F (M6 metalloprotease family) [Bacillus niacini]|uniref:Bacillopeptidase F (M6 metalloprotease family) n=1 Tax=Neobacillus niacini TaxID=86668 RepID=A0A852T940_9BACI|nr:carboxypeptidase-like regulatory domain-containing protein [Neobacillus niacini]NYE03934.1 bacillopeptidase F (M6 metalloprotease family) [Neobacillus niacini]
MAGPHVAAAIALLLQANSSLTVDELEEILMTTAVPLTDNTYPESPNNGYGSGLLNVYDAVSSVISGLGKLKGQVTKEGNDSEAPVLEHSQPATVFAGMPLTLQASAADNISVTNVEVVYQLADGTSNTIAAERINGDYKNGIYQAAIPGEHIAGESFSYTVRVTDFGGNETINQYSVAVLPGITVGYAHDFESNPDGWTTYGALNTWEWGAPTSGPGAAFSGEKVYGTNLDGTYDSRANMSLRMPPIDLPEGRSYLQFKQWYNLERNYDYGHVYVSTDNVNWVQKLRVNNLSNGWIDGEVDLSEYAGQRIYVAFNVRTDGSVVRDGWYLDDVRITDTALTAPQQLGVVAEKQDSSEKDGLKEKVDSNKITIQIPEVSKETSSEKAAPFVLPMQAQVTVLESGRSVRTNPANGSFEMTHAAGEFKVVAESYGFRSETQTVNIEQDGEVTANFTLEELPKGTVTGTVINQATGEPVSGATVYLIEDANIAPVATDASGHYSLTGFEGDYTLKIFAPHFYSQEVSVSLQGTIAQNFELKPFIGYPSEIGYDDGTAENARAFYDAGNGWAVKMSLAPGNEKALVSGGLFRFWDTEWPVPGGTNFKVEVYDASGPDGAPGKKLAGPIDATALRNGQWTHVDLSSHGIVVEGDFYLVYIQAGINTASPGLATDEDGENAIRSWQLVGGAWSPSPEEEGNYMIRAVVDYEVTAPTITTPVDGSFTNVGTVKVEGKAAPTTTVHIYNHGEEIGTAEAANNGTYAVDVSLQEGENSLTAKASTVQGITDPSAPAIVVYDPTAPELAITSPADGGKINKETVTVTGTVVDDYLNSVTVNGTPAKVESGTYSARVLLDEGTNSITVTAEDRAGNRTEQTVQIAVDFTAPVIADVKPAEDKTLKKGESVKIEFTSEPGLKTSFVIHMPLTNLNSVQNATVLPLMEVSPGYYVGYYTATKDMTADGAVIEVKAVDSFGNETRKTAAGKLFINVKKKK